MKNFIACLGLASCILSAFPVNAEDMGYAAMIASDYYRWGIIFGVSDISTDFRYADKDEFGDGTLYLDDIAVVYDWSNLEADSIYMFFGGNSGDISHQIMRMNALVAALEYDEHPQPEEWSFTLAGEMLVKTMPVYQELCTVICDEKDSILTGKYVPFHESQEWTYYVSYDSAMGYVIIVQ